MSWACDLVAEMLPILKKTIFVLIIRGQVLDMTKNFIKLLIWPSKEMSQDLCHVSATGARGVFFLEWGGGMLIIIFVCICLEGLSGEGGLKCIKHSSLSQLFLRYICFFGHQAISGHFLRWPSEKLVGKITYEPLLGLHSNFVWLFSRYLWWSE